tara:strand:- start:195 stop:800 length:606 start_codon:yes stop_codon:yes gene_type:complete
VLKFTKITSEAACLLDINIDTDAIIPKQFLKTIERSGLGKYLFFDSRFKKNNTENEDFILNKKPWRKAQIIIAGDNFGCGSSREHAPWALLDFGIRCIISTSFADIFYNNSIKNGLFPLVLKRNQIKELIRQANKKDKITVDLKQKKIFFSTYTYSFEVANFIRDRLLNGHDDIELTLKHLDSIEIYEKKKFNNKTWKTLK